MIDFIEYSSNMTIILMKFILCIPIGFDSLHKDYIIVKHLLYIIQYRLVDSSVKWDGGWEKGSFYCNHIHV